MFFLRITAVIYCHNVLTACQAQSAAISPQKILGLQNLSGSAVRRSVIRRHAELGSALPVSQVMGRHGGDMLVRRVIEQVEQAFLGGGVSSRSAARPSASAPPPGPGGAGDEHALLLSTRELADLAQMPGLKLNCFRACDGRDPSPSYAASWWTRICERPHPITTSATLTEVPIHL